MKQVSIEDAYLWAQRFIAREWRLILPVAFALMALPPLMLDLLMPQSVPMILAAATQSNNPAQAIGVLRWLVPVFIVIFLIASIGGLAITALALLPGTSVREALVLALRRLGVLVASLLLVAVGELLVVILVSALAAFGGLSQLGLQSLLLGVMMGIALFAGVRLIPLVPMIVRRRIGPISAIRESWMMTSGAFWRVLGAVLVYLIGAIVVMIALSNGVGAMLLLLGKAVGAPELGKALNAVFGRGLAALIGVGLHLLAAAIYRQLDGSMRGT